MTQRDKRLLVEYSQAYAYAQTKTGVPIAVLATLHYREAALYLGHYSKPKARVVKNIGGPFMLDLGPADDPVEFRRRIRAYEQKVYRIYRLRGPVPRVSENLRFAALVAAHEFLTKVRCRPLRDDCLADAFWGYNGRADWHRGRHQNSAYVWSDPQHGVFLKVRHRTLNGEWKEYVDTRPGTMVIYREIQEFFHANNSY